MWRTLIERLFGRRPGRQRGSIVPGIADVGDALLVTVECDRCREVISVRLRKSSDIQRNYDDQGAEFYVRKTIVGKKCFNRIDLELEMDTAYRPVSTQIRGGKLHPGESSA